MEELKMKKLLVFAVLPLFIVAGCTTQYQAKAPYDDVYYSSRDLPAAASTKVIVTQAQVPVASDYNPSNNREDSQDTTQQSDNQATGTTEYSNYNDEPSGAVSESYTEPGGDTYISNYYDNYYDYAYASRLRRFHSNSFMDSYYNDYYSNMYFYDYNPWSWGTSIYFNSGWYSPSFGMNFEWGWPSYSYGWGYPSYGNYWSGYYDGYYDGYWAGNGNHGWYSNDGGGYNNGNYYYGHRGQSGFSGGSSNGRNDIAPRDQKSGQDVNPRDNPENSRGYGIGSASVAGGISTRGEVTPSSGNASGVNGRSLKNTNSQPRQRTNSPFQVNERSRQNTQPGRTTNPGYRGSYIAPSKYTQRKQNTGNVLPGRQVSPQSKITNPQQPVNNRMNVVTAGHINNGRENSLSNTAQSARIYQQQRTRIQSYSSPSYTKPRSSQEYTTPKYRNIRNNDNPSPSPQYSQPQQRSMQSGNYERRSSDNQRQSGSQATPERQPSSPAYSAPSRSSENSYTAPSRSSNSTNSSSTPSRSSSGSSNSSNSSNSSGSGRPRR